VSKECIGVIKQENSAALEGCAFYYVPKREECVLCHKWCQEICLYLQLRGGAPNKPRRKDFAYHMQIYGVYQ